jgi:hypothetical protein
MFLLETTSGMVYDSQVVTGKSDNIQRWVESKP